MEMQDTLIVVSLTQTEINAILTPETAGIVYNSTTSTVQFYDGAAWVNGSGEINTASNAGAGSGVFKAKVGDDLEFRSLIGGTNVTLVPGTDDITINASGGGGGDLLSTNNLSDVTNAVTSLGNLGGEPVFAKNTGFNKDFGTIAGTVLEGNTTTITGAESTKLAFITVTQAVDLDTIESDTSANNAKNSYPSADATKVSFISVTQAVDLDTLESDVTTNNAKNTYPSADSTKVGFISVTQAVDLDTIETDVATNTAKNSYPSGDATKVGHLTVTQAVDLDTMESDIATNNAKNSYPSGDATKVGHLTVTQAVDLDTIESDVATNNAKVTNATHTGEVTGSGALTVGPTAISNRASVTAVAGMDILVDDSGTLKKVDASDFLGGGALESFYLERVETIDNNSGTAIEYFTEVQGGTEITNTVTAVGGTYNFELSFVCRNTSNNGSCEVNPQLNTSDIFAVDYTVEPDDGNNIYYVNISKRITLSAGVNTIDINLSNAGSGTARIYEANVIISKV